MANTGKKLGYLLEVNKYIDDALVAVSTWNLLNAFTIQGRSYPLITTDQLKLFSAFLKKKDFSNIAHTFTNFINLVLFEIKIYFEENKILDDI